MSQEQLDESSKNAVKPVKNKMTLDRFVKQFNSLDTTNYGGWPISVKITCWIFIFILVCIVGYFVLISSKMDSIATAQAQETNLLNEYREKDSKLRNLQLYQKQLVKMQADFNQQLQQLPKESEIPGLVEDINVTGVTAGLKFKNISLDPEVKQEFFMEQPISIQATGDYHVFGQFASAISALPRIVTMHDFTIVAGQDESKKSDIPVVTYTVHAKTYRYLGAEEQVSASEPQSGAAK